MAGLSPNELQNILGRARRLCNTQGDKLVTAHSDQSNFTRQLDESYNVPSVEDFDDADKWDSLYSSESEQAYKKSNLPENIKKSLMENPINTNTAASVLDEMDIPRERKTVAAQKREAINEGRVAPNAYAGGGIDYALIKTIVSECVREALAQQPLNEGALSKVYLKNGTISLVDNKGNVFQAKLEKIGNTNNQ